MNQSIRVTAVVVTYNRKKLLLECLAAIRSQTFPVQRVLLIDNASTDGTQEAVEALGAENLTYIRMDTNTGGAGGFYHGLKKAREEDCGWFWLMDDDTIPQPDSLEKLLRGVDAVRRKKGRDPGFAASTVYGPKGEYMNVPEISTRRAENGYCGWYDMLEDGIVEVDTATFVSVLINRDAVLACGLPCRDFFLWGDDSEYTGRIGKYYGPGFLIGSSRVLHKRTNAKALNIALEEDRNRLKLYHYLYRNNAITWRLYRGKSGMVTLLNGAWDSLQLLLRGHGIRKAGIVMKGILEAMMQYRRFRTYVRDQISGGPPPAE